ncbi:MAG: 50S ribosomal protein L29 [Anaerolineaceae bacterium]|jgi:large subunit ribosomal protein L29|nr:50S ribosomal protein L29 [Anaerolineaceae bacterium]
MKPAEIRNMSDEEIRSRIEDTREELMNLRFRVVTGQLTDTSQLKIVRRSIARLETILHERELVQEREGE